MGQKTTTVCRIRTSFGNKKVRIVELWSFSKSSSLWVCHTWCVTFSGLFTAYMEIVQLTLFEYRYMQYYYCVKFRSKLFITHHVIDQICLLLRNSHVLLDILTRWNKVKPHYLFQFLVAGEMQSGPPFHTVFHANDHQQCKDSFLLYCDRWSMCNSVLYWQLNKLQFDTIRIDN